MYGAPSRERMNLLKAELADVRDGLAKCRKDDDRKVFEEMAGDLEREIKREERAYQAKR